MLRHETSRIKRDQALAKEKGVPADGSPHLPSVKLSISIADYELKISRVAVNIRREIVKLTNMYWQQQGAKDWVNPYKAWSDKWQAITRNIDTFDFDTNAPSELTRADLIRNIAH